MSVRTATVRKRVRCIIADGDLGKEWSIVLEIQRLLCVDACWNVRLVERASASEKLKALDRRIYREFRAFLERVTFGRNSSKVRIVVSQRMKEQFVRHYGDAAKDILVIPNSADLKIFTPANQPLYRARIRQKHGISHGDLVLLFAGGDWERKGVPYII